MSLRRVSSGKPLTFRDCLRRWCGFYLYHYNIDPLRYYCSLWIPTAIRTTSYTITTRNAHHAPKSKSGIHSTGTKMRMKDKTLRLIFAAALVALLLNQFYWGIIKLDWKAMDDFNHFHLLLALQRNSTNKTIIFPPSVPTRFENITSTIAPLRPTIHALSSNQENPTICETLDTTAWANQPRLRNVDPRSPQHQHVVTESITHNALSIVDDLLAETLCQKQGRFRTTSTTTMTPGHQWRNTSNLALLKDWEFKLIYLAIHDFHHRPAREEYEEEHALHQQCPSSQATLRTTNDFPCRRSKFLVTSIPNLGLGSAMRLSAVSHVLSAIATDRIPLFVANTTVGPKFLQDPWYLASCDRRDYQCVFLPTTPCTLLDADLEAATLVEGNVATMNIRLKGKMLGYWDQHRVLILEANSNSATGDSYPGIEKEVRQRVYERAVKLLDEWHNTTSPGGAAHMHESKFHFLQEAAKRILQADDVPVGRHHKYGHRNYKISHAILLYLLRPNKRASKILDEHMKHIFPHPVTPETTIGLPIRGSDKCDRESTCLAFDRYMRLAKETWEGSLPMSGARGALILTTEDEAVFHKRLFYNESGGFPLDFIVNEKDSLQGTGKVDIFGQNADDIMMSSLVAMQMQLHAGHVYGNCCSNFHLMLFDLVREGCGLTTEATCLQETDNYKVCCVWERTDECRNLRKEYQKAQKIP